MTDRRLLLLPLLLTACSVLGSSGYATLDEPVVDERDARELRVRPGPLGLTESEAERQARADGFAVLRVLSRDGRELDRTSDRRPDRLNASVEDGRVVSTSAY